MLHYIVPYRVTDISNIVYRYNTEETIHRAVYSLSFPKDDTENTPHAGKFQRILSF